MNHHHPESLDETIDRVAAHLTMVPADPGLASRIAARLDRHAPFAWTRLAVASAAVAAVVAAFVFLNNARQVPATDVAHRVTAAPAADGAVVGQEVAAVSTSLPEAIAAAGGTHDRNALAAAEEPLPEMPQLEALASPVTIDVALLATDTLTIDAVDLAPLELSDLAMHDIDESDSPKE